MSAALASSSPLLRGVVLGARLGLERLRHRRTAGWLGLAVALAVAGAVIERDAGSLGAVDRALAGTFRLLIPLLTLALVGRAASREGLGPGSFPLARFGLPRFAVALGVAAAPAVAAALASALLAALTVAFAHSASAPPLAADMLLSAWIGAVTALAYAGWVALGTTFFRGRGAWVPVGADFLFGGSTGLVAALLPRAHASSLLHLSAGPLDLSRPVSSAALFLMAGAMLLAAAARAGR
jgi:hypothetical protein